MNALRVAAVQMVSADTVEASLAQARPLVEDAARQGAGLVLLPEYFGLMGARGTDKLAVAERDGDGVQQRFLAGLAKRLGIVIVGGCVPMGTDDPNHVRSACLVYGEGGSRLARYDKMHLFAFSAGGENYDESRTIAPGDAPASFELPIGRIALSICYDLRFPELYRSMGALALILVPAAFTVPTGRAHWELLLRARAVENQCYVLAAAQGGMHAGGRSTFGHSMLVDPWGEIVASLPAGPGVVMGDVEATRIAQVRAKLPALTHRRITQCEP